MYLCRCSRKFALLLGGLFWAGAVGAGAALPSAPMFFDWAERTFPTYFPGAQADQTLGPYTYRYYPATQTYLALDADAVYALGPPTQNALQRLVGLADVACQVNTTLCASTQPLDTHPRLWLTGADLPRLRSWATASNPVYRDGLAVLAARAKGDMDRGALSADCGGREYEEYPSESYAELFAFLSLVEPQADVRADYAQRARTVLMGAINQAAQGPATERSHACGYPPFQDPDFFSTDSNRARWHGEGFALAADWIYPSLNASDKATLRRVFLRWAQDIVERGYHHPEPPYARNDAVLADTESVRWAGNNYFTAHMRNLGLMALALDAADDPDTSLRNYLGHATDAWLLQFDRLTRTDSLGGLLPEGTEYSPQTASYAAQFLLALRTAGVDTCASRCQLAANPFWDDLIRAYFHSLSPATVANTESAGTLYQPSLYGDAQNYRMPDHIDAFGAMGVLDGLGGYAGRLNALRWAQIHTAPGGESQWLRRVSNSEDFRQSILYFLLHEPGVTPQDPRPNLPLAHFAPGLNKLLVRTAWDPAASWLTFTASWRQIDHQTADGNHFEWYRKGEWLTKARSGYPDIAEGIASSEFYNTVAIENDRPNRDATDWRMDLWQRGSQWNYVSSGAPTVLARYDSRDYTYMSADATALYNSSSEGSEDVQLAQRTLVWLKQADALVVVDAAQSRTANRFKRWWLQLANPANVHGQYAVSSTPQGQQLRVTSLRPSGATLSAVGAPDASIESKVARDEPMKVRLRIDAPSSGTGLVPFVTVLQAFDGQASNSPLLLAAASEHWHVVQIGSWVVAAAQPGAPIGAGLEYTVQNTDAQTLNHVIVGLTPGGAYRVERNGAGFTLQAGGERIANHAGVLEVAGVNAPSGSVQ